MPPRGSVRAGASEAWRLWHRLACEGTAQDRVTAAARNRVAAAFRRVWEHMGNPPSRRAGVVTTTAMVALIHSGAFSGGGRSCSFCTASYTPFPRFFGLFGEARQGHGRSDPVVRILHLSPREGMND